MNWAATEMDNLRAAFAWSRENSELEAALQLILSLRPLWLRGGRVREAMAALDAILADEGTAPAVWAGAVTLQSIIAASMGIPTEPSRAQEALAIARRVDDPALIAQALIACGMLAFYDPDAAEHYFGEAIDLARASDDQWSLCQIFSHQATVGVFSGETIAARAAAEAGRDLADALGDHFVSRGCRAYLSTALINQGELAHATRVGQAGRRGGSGRRPDPQNVGSSSSRRGAGISGAVGCRARRSAIRPNGRNGSGCDLQGRVVLRIRCGCSRRR